ncbi:phospholipid scramblase-related protein [Thalassoglobus sp. JC818]|uniref:phospholipid scramblase-related protein n=1 Tax=Thalassoglobus sp. JC818 TaxID=3232136 RepID=UPI00345A9FD0
MHEALQRNLFLVIEHVGMFKSASNYDVYDPSSGEMILHCREPRLGWITKMLRFTDYKTLTPFEIYITSPDGEPVISVHRGVSLFLSKVDVHDDDGDRIGGFKQKLFSIGGAFHVLGENDEILCDLKGSFTGWEFRFLHDGIELAKVSKKWNGLGKEMFTSADNYMLEISEEVPMDNPIRMLILGSVMCIDMVLKEA